MPIIGRFAVREKVNIYNQVEYLSEKYNEIFSDSEKKGQQRPLPLPERLKNGMLSDFCFPFLDFWWPHAILRSKQLE